MADSLAAAEGAAEAAAGRICYNIKIWIFYWSYFLAGYF